MKKSNRLFCIGVGVLLASSSSFIAMADTQAKTVRLEALDLTNVSQGWGEPSVNASISGTPLTIAGKVYEHGIGSHAPGVVRLELDGLVNRFQAEVGIDEAAGEKGSVAFLVYADGKQVFDSGIMKNGDATKVIDLSLKDVRSLILYMDAGKDGKTFDHANWVNTVFTFVGVAPVIVTAPVEKKVILTPRPPVAPQLNGPLVYGVSPKKPFLYRIPCTGKRPIEFSINNLPKGLVLDATTGIVRGTIENPAATRYTLEINAKNAQGTDQRAFTIAVGDTLALTPPMGWNSWYIHYYRVTEDHMRQAAHAMVESGMADYGYQYVNIDDCWMKKKGDEPYRSATGAALPNSKFPDMKGMVDEIHGLGLKAGIYTSPGPWTCAMYVGAYQHEQAEIDQYVAWGFDFLKYDWCSYNKIIEWRDVPGLKAPYEKISKIMQTSSRDIVLNLCQYGAGDVWEWGKAVGGHCSRTTGDLGLMQGSQRPGFYNIGLRNAAHDQFAEPGYWNDPDYLLIGWVGATRGHKVGKETTLTGNEQYSYMSMWSLMAAPLIFSGDMGMLDDFTLNILCNREVISIDQDPLGKQARVIRNDGKTLVMAKELADGSIAVGLFNLFETELEVSASWEELGLEGQQTIRDLWRQADEGTTTDSVSAKVARHGVKLVRLIKK